ncbi:amidohydrolase family protein [Pasteurella bettyae]|uniref:Amidohydrolase family protein n=1 Tax=Pasteurella bettyae CCUG 2042 TaxID=1095749 RepID=I3DBG7_9PAST|nr:amidohydrolase family protein [Pasteurella bettyae]EIJ69060.1 amidohydrolase family protein [Pasteurella bettyae CCUG 2042]SUB22854.1 Predicted metal-dependent hydrolase of the TIM-barrel fold [Pasteurella bettyae]
MTNETDIKFTSFQFKNVIEQNFKLPNHTCDCHHHIFNRNFPYTPEDTRDLPNATMDDFVQFKKYMGVERHILVQPSSYGVDNRCLIDALEKGGKLCRGEAVIDESFTHKQLQDLADKGVVGIRFNFGAGNYASADNLLTLAERVHEFNWHIQIHAKADQLSELYPLLTKIKNPIIFDHYAQLKQPTAFKHPFWKQLLKLIDQQNCWVKLSGPYHTSTKTDFSDLEQITKEFLRIAPERLVWGSDWPHPNLTSSHKNMPDDRYFLALFNSWLGSDAMRQKIFVDNPTTFFFK